MTINRRSKTSRHRGSWTHSHGEKKKRRGAGSRGGRGNAGSGKRGDAKKPSYWKIKNFSGKHGFTNPTTRTINCISISQLNTRIVHFVQAGLAVQEGNIYKLNCADINIKKLLGTGKPSYAYEIVVTQVTPGAKKKIEEAGGKVLQEVAEEVSSEVVTE